ncbi:hypothetical protein [Actinophytocola sp.]|uniref:hypothetical protein n=1 Tax=Actinophytocola sp. TaxID=1872138 RepID=UPI002ED4F70D
MRPTTAEPEVVAAPPVGDSPSGSVGADTLLPLAPPPTPVVPPGGEFLVTAPVATARRSGVVLGGRDSDFGDDFGGVHRATVLAGPLAPPDQPGRRLIRYDLLAGAALVLALLALVPLLLLRGDPDEIPSKARLPAAGESNADKVTVELAEPTDLTDKVQLNWKATRDLDFAVVVAAEGEKPQVLLVQRNRTMTVDVDPERKYCFLIQATDGDQVYESEPQPLRGAVCQK